MFQPVVNKDIVSIAVRAGLCLQLLGCAFTTSWLLLQAAWLCNSAGQRTNVKAFQHGADKDVVSFPHRPSKTRMNRALRRLTSEVRKDPVHSTRYGRQRNYSKASGPQTRFSRCTDTLGNDDKLLTCRVLYPENPHNNACQV